MSLKVRRLVIAAPIAELIPVAVLTALLPMLLASGTGTLVYQIMEAQRLALWVGPIGGFVTCALAGWWVSRGTVADEERNGLTLGVAVAGFDLALLAVSGAPFGALMVLSATGRIAGGYAGGWWAGRRNRPAAPAARAAGERQYARREDRRVSIDPSPKADPWDVFQSVWYRLALLFTATYLTVFWFVLGPSNPWYGVMLAVGTCSLDPVVDILVRRRMPRRRSRVPAGERVLHRIVGVGIFGWLLDVSGWNRQIKPLRGFSVNKAGLPSLAQGARTGAVAHGICFAIHVLLAVLALVSRHPWSAALWILLPAVVVHLYPVLLQRSMMLRLQPLLDKSGS